MRELARERAGVTQGTQARHVRHYLDASEAASRLLDGPMHRAGADALRADLAELRAAYGAAIAPADRARLALTLDRALGLQAEKPSSRRERLAEARTALASVQVPIHEWDVVLRLADWLIGSLAGALALSNGAHETIR